MILISGSNQALLISSSLDVDLSYSVFYVKQSNFQTSSSFGYIRQKTGSYALSGIDDNVFVKEIQVYNYSTSSMATGSALVKILFESASRRFQLARGYLTGEESLVYNEEDGFQVKDEFKSLKTDNILGNVGWNYPCREKWVMGAAASSGNSSDAYYFYCLRPVPWNITSVTHSIFHSTAPTSVTSASMMLGYTEFGHTGQSSGVTNDTYGKLKYNVDITSDFVANACQFKANNIFFPKNSILVIGTVVKGSGPGGVRVSNTSQQTFPYYGRSGTTSVYNIPGLHVGWTPTAGTNTVEAVIFPEYKNED